MQNTTAVVKKKEEKKNKTLLDHVYTDQKFVIPQFDEEGKVTYQEDTNYKNLMQEIENRISFIMGENNNGNLQLNAVMRSMFLSVHTKNLLSETLQNKSFQLIMSRMMANPESFANKDLIALLKTTAAMSSGAPFEVGKLLDIVNAVKMWDAEEKQKVKQEKFKDDHQLSEQQTKKISSALMEAKKRILEAKHKNKDDNVIEVTQKEKNDE